MAIRMTMYMLLDSSRGISSSPDAWNVSVSHGIIVSDETTGYRMHRAIVRIPRHPRANHSCLWTVSSQSSASDTVHASFPSHLVQ